MSQFQLEGNVDTRDQEILALRGQLARIDEALRLERIKTGSVEAGARELRRILTPLFSALKQIYGEMDDMQIAESPIAAPQFDPRWDSWKQKLGNGTAPAKVIDALLTHGFLTRTQLRPVAGIGWSTLDAATSRLKNLGLIEKNGDRWQLRAL